MNGVEHPKILNANGEAAQERPKSESKIAAQEQPKPEEGPKIAAQIVVTMFEDGKMNVSGAIVNKTFAYGLLEAAKDVIRQYVDQANAPRVATPQQPGFFRNLLRKNSHISAKR